MPSFEGLHDITMTDLPPRRKPYLIMAPEDRIGTTYIPVDPEKVVAIVESVSGIDLKKRRILGLTW